MTFERLPRNLLPPKRFKDTKFRERYDAVTEFDIVPARRIIWKSFRNDTDFGGLEALFENANLMGIANYSMDLVSPSLVREFYENISHDISEVKKKDYF